MQSLTTKAGDTGTPAAAYEAAVESERGAWQALRALPTDTPDHERERAWSQWSDAIKRTNRAWRGVLTGALEQRHAQ